MKVAFQGIIKLLRRKMLVSGDVEGEMLFRIAPIKDDEWDQLSRLQQPEKTVMLVVMDEGEATDNISKNSEK